MPTTAVDGVSAVVLPTPPVETVYHNNVFVPVGIAVKGDGVSSLQ